MLRGRAVTVWPDADVTGLEYARQVAKLFTPAAAPSVARVSPPAGVAVGWDAADAVAQGWDGARAAELVAAAKPPERKGGGRDDEEHRGRRRTPQRDTLIGLTDPCELWHDANRTAYVTFSVNAHNEHWPVRSREFRMWLSGQFYEATGGAIGGQALEDSIRPRSARGERGAGIRTVRPHRPLREKVVSRPVQRAMARGRDHRCWLGGGR
jgi:DNA primase